MEIFSMSDKQQTEKDNIIVDCDGVLFKVINAGTYEDKNGRGY